MFPIVFAAMVGFAIVLILRLIDFYFRRGIRALREKTPPGERIQQSISKLSSASQEIDDVIQDIVQNIEYRQAVLEELKKRHLALLQEEGELSKRVKILKDVPLEVAQFFQQISEEALQRTERKRARRDIVMFVSGILVTTVMAILLKIFGWA